MARQITLNTGLSNVLLPNQQRYDGSAVVILSDQEYSQLSASWKSANLSADVPVSGGSGSVTSVTAGDGSIVVGGTGTAPTIETGTLDVIAADHPPAASVPMNSHKFTGLGNGAASGDSVAFGQLGSAAFQPSSAFDAAGTSATETTRAEAAEALLAPLASPALTGTPTAPTKAALTNNTDIATTAYTDTAVAVEASRATTAEGLLIPSSQKAAASGVATLDSGTHIPAAQLPAATTSTQGAVQLDSTASDIKPTSTAAATGSSAKAPSADHVHTQDYLGVFGDGSDGSVTLDGTTTFNGFSSLAGSTYTLTRDVYATNLTINNTVILKPAGYRIFCQGTFTDNVGSTVTVFGGAGNANGTAGTGGGSQGSVGNGKSGGAGNTGAGTAGNNTNCAGYGTGGAGGTGSSGASGTGGTSGATGNTWFKPPAGALSGVVFVTGTSTGITGGPGGGGGGGDGTNKGGGGGGGGGVIVIFAWAIVHNGTYTATGGNGGTPATTTGGCGGGGGGSGGLILTYSLSAPTGSGTSSVAGGALGSGVGTGTAGGAGATGTILNQVLA